ncbi:hypothetical protein EMIT0P291_240072 [Pseudomonas sp. IT-P291]
MSFVLVSLLSRRPVTVASAA